MQIRCLRLEGLHLSTIPMVHMDSSKLVVNMGVAEVAQAVVMASLVRQVVAAQILVVAILDTLDRLVARLVVALDTLVAQTLVALDTLVVACQTQALVVASHLVVDILGSSLDSRAALVVAVEDPEVGVALGGARRLQGKSFAMAVVKLAILLPTAHMLQKWWTSTVAPQRTLQQ